MAIVFFNIGADWIGRVGLNYLIGFIFVGILHFIVSFFHYDSIYAFFRHLSIVYSAFVFFVAIWTYEDVKRWHYEIPKLFRGLILALTLMPIPGLIYRLSALYIYPFFANSRHRNMYFSSKFIRLKCTPFIKKD
jgi:hypothetical protein